MNSQHIIIAACFAIPAMIIITIAATRCAWHKGKRAGQRTSEKRIAELQDANFALCRHVRDLKLQASSAQHNAAQALEQQQLQHDEALAAAKAGTPAITETDLKNIQRMADMLNHMSLDLRNKNRFKDSKEAANRAATGQRLIDRLYQELFHALNPPDAEGFTTIGSETSVICNGTPRLLGGVLQVRKEYKKP